MNTDLILQHVSRHIQLDKTEADFFVSLLRHQTIPKKGFLLKTGEVCKTENFIVKGCMRIYTIDENGFEHIVLFGIENWWVGDLYSFLTQKPSVYYIDALEDTQVLQITKTDLDLLYERVPKFERFFRLIIQNAYIAHQQRIDQNLSAPAELRYIQFMEKYPAFVQRIPQKQIAAYLGITPEFLSMLRRKLAKG